MVLIAQGLKIYLLASTVFDLVLFLYLAMHYIYFAPDTKWAILVWGTYLEEYPIVLGCILFPIWMVLILGDLSVCVLVYQWFGERISYVMASKSLNAIMSIVELVYFIIAENKRPHSYLAVILVTSIICAI